jgi:hypothetical protein
MGALGAAVEGRAAAPERRRGAAEEEVGEEPGGIAEVDAPVAVVVEEASVRGVACGPVAAGKPRRRAAEEVAQEADAVGDVERPVLVAVARAAEWWRRKAQAEDDAGVRLAALPNSPPYSVIP